MYCYRLRSPYFHPASLALLWDQLPSISLQSTIEFIQLSITQPALTLGSLWMTIWLIFGWHCSSISSKNPAPIFISGNSVFYMDTVGTANACSCSILLQIAVAWI